MPEIINEEFFLCDAKELAQKLLGKILVRTINTHTIKARIVETEAYCGINDKASHTYGNKKTPRTLPLYDQGGTTYVYFIYGMYYCLNVVANSKNVPQGVLIRAVEIIDGLEFAQHNLAASNQHKHPRYWTNGPGKLTIALKIDRSLNHLPILNNHQLTLISDDFVVDQKDIVLAPRINIEYAQEDKYHLWRFYLKNNLYVSKIIK